MRFLPAASAKKRSRLRRLMLEPLDDRLLLAGLTGDHVLAEASGTIRPDATSDLSLSVERTRDSVRLGLLMSATDGSSLDPAAIRLQTSDGQSISPSRSEPDRAGGRESLAVFDLPLNEATDFTITVGADRGTSGDYLFQLFVPGSSQQALTTGIEQNDFLQAAAALLQSLGRGNAVSQRFFRSQGIDLARDQFRVELDANVNNQIDVEDLDAVRRNLGEAVAVTLISDRDPPAVSATLSVDSGRSPTDRVTNDFTSTLDLIFRDESGIVETRVGLAGTPSVDAAGTPLVDLIAITSQPVESGVPVSLTLADLERIAGNGAGNGDNGDGTGTGDNGQPVANGGKQTLLIAAVDLFGNARTNPVAIDFEFDTLVPAAPQIDLTASSDSGASDADRITRDNTPTFVLDAEDNAHVQLFSSLVDDGGTAIGDGFTNGPITVTTGELLEGTHAVQAEAIDLAGNTSARSVSLPVTIDRTVQPPEFDSDPPVSATALMQLDFIGRTDPDAVVQLLLGTTEVRNEPADGNGDFRFPGVPLPFGESEFAAVATDVAGNTSQPILRTFSQNNPPTAADDDASTAEGTAIDINVLADNGHGPDADANLAAGDVLTIVQVGQPDRGTVRLNPDQTVQFDPAEAFESLGVNDVVAESFTYTIRDSRGAEAVATVTVAIQGENDTPVAADDLFATSEDVAFTRDVLDGTGSGGFADMDPDGDTLMVSGINGTTDFTGLSALGAMIAMQPDGAFTYDPAGAAVLQSLDAGETAEDSFTYSIHDGHLGTSAATVTVSVQGVNDNPTPGMPSFTVFSADETAVSRTVLGGAMDPDAADSLSAVADGSITTLQGATVDLSADGTFVYDANDQFAALNPGDQTTDSFVFMLTDGTVELPATVNLVVIANRPPNAVDDRYENAVEGERLDLSDATAGLLQNDSDPGGNDAALTVLSAATSMHGAPVTALPDGTFTYDPRGVPAFESLGSGGLLEDTFTYVVQDERGATATGTATVVVSGRNDTPVTADDAATTSEDAPVAGNVLDGSLSVGDSADSDIDGDSLVVREIAGTGSLTGTSELGADVALQADGRFDYDPRNATALQALASGDSEIDRFDYTIDDGHGGTAVGTVRVTVTGVNDAPVGGSDSFTVSSTFTTTISQDVRANDVDPENDSLSVLNGTFLTDAGAEVTLNEDGTFSYNPGDVFTSLTPPGTTDSFAYTVTDGLAFDSGVQVNLTVVVNRPPVAVNDVYVGATEDDLFEIADPADGVLQRLNEADERDFDPDDPTAMLQVTTGLTFSDMGASISLNADGTFTYDPVGVPTFQVLAAGSAVTDSFTYTVRDEQGATADGTVSIEVAGRNDAPQLTPASPPRQVPGSTARVAVADLIDPGAGALISDEDDGTTLGLAIVEFSGGGTLSVLDGPEPTPVTGVSATDAILVSGTADLEYSTAGSGFQSSIRFVAWDGSAHAAGQRVDTTTDPPASSPFSSDSDTLTFTGILQLTIDTTSALVVTDLDEIARLFGAEIAAFSANPHSS